MREVSRRDGCVALCGEAGDEDLVVVVELGCTRCHRVHAHIRLGARVHR
jgi:hypothetical protein